MALDLPDGGFDAVVSVGSIKHWPDPVRGLKEARRVCRGAGRVVVAEVHRGCSIEDCRRLVSGWRWMLPGGRGIAAQYFNRFVAAGGVRREDLFAWAGEAGFEDIHARSVPGWPYIMATAKA
jgi:ubiquinone/menaquinone biosynthesis C-methylase UbiE